MMTRILRRGYFRRGLLTTIILILIVSIVSAQYIQYVVRPGDTLSGIARAYNVSVYELMRVNYIPNPNHIYYGQVLNIPVYQPPPNPYPPHPQPPVNPPAGTIVHTVQYGETLGGIAQRYGTTVPVLMQYNPWIVNPSYIYVGQQIIVPVSPAVPPTPPPVNPYPPVTPPPQTVPYVVQYGDTLSQIAQRYNVWMQGIVTQNGIANPSRIYANQILYIPQPGNPNYLPYYGYPVVQPPPPTPVPPPPPPPPGTTTYVVQYGDTLQGIANQFGVDVWDLARANGIFNLNRIYVGQVLVIP